MTYGAWLKSRRLKAGLRQTDLAERIGIDPTYITKIETGKIGLPLLETRMRIHAALGSSEQELRELGVLDEQAVVSPGSVADADQPAGAYDGLPPHLRASFLRVGELSEKRQEQLSEYLDYLFTIDDRDFQNTKRGRRK